MTFIIRSVQADEDEIKTYLCRDPQTGELLALDDDGHDRMGLVNRAFLREVLTKQDLWSSVPSYVEEGGDFGDPQI